MESDSLMKISIFWPSEMVQDTLRKGVTESVLDAKDPISTAVVLHGEAKL